MLALAAPLHARELGFRETLELAEATSVQVLIAQGQLRAAEADLDEARAVFWNNPQLSTEIRSRKLAAPEGSVGRRDSAVGFSQAFETGGQPGARRHAARSMSAAAKAALDQARRDARLEAAKQFVQLLLQQHRADLEASSVALARQAAEVVDKRLRAGEVTRLDANLALVEAERNAAQLSQIREELLQTRAAFAAALRLAPGDEPVARGAFPQVPPGPDFDALKEAVVRTPRLAAAAAREASARHRLDLEQASRSPDVTVGLSRSVERNVEGTDRVTTLSISLPLPIYRNNRAGVARALAELDQASAELRAAARDAEASIGVFQKRWQQASERLQRLERVILPALQTNERLSLAALRAGEINITQFLLARRQAIEAQREVLDARAQTLLLHIEFLAATTGDLLAAWPVNSAGHAQPGEVR